MITITTNHYTNLKPLSYFFLLKIFSIYKFNIIIYTTLHFIHKHLCILNYLYIIYFIFTCTYKDSNSINSFDKKRDINLSINTSFM